ncbi:CRISPR-associated endoribonuclease Cas6 [Spirillospora sp. CA-294931]|uniref:CRISPR-associated endoribonuclease Cas6 n=1 Tax=Spirillospora sp. CA-294931 TaxID=3240042 RepID=UPI003D89E19E
MRFRLDVSADRPELAWRDVHGPARGVVYGLLSAQDPELASEIHDSGWAGHPLRPVGISPPLFSGTKARKGVYTTSATGSVWMGSPVPQIAGCLLAALAGSKELRWGGVRLTIKGMQLDPSPDHSSGVGVFESVSPVVVKHDDRYLVPDEAHYVDRLLHNIRHKADVLGLPSAVQLEVLEAGPRRRFDVQGAMRIGATVTVRVQGAPELLDALYDWGLGLCCVQGFGWVR